MLTSDDQIYPTLCLLGEKQEASGESKNKVMEIAKRFGLNPSSHMNYLPWYTTEKIIEFYKKRKTQNTHKWWEEQEAKLSDSEKEKLISFLTEIPLNSVTKTLQEKLYPIAKDWYPDIDMLIYLRKTRNYFGLLSAHKQIRSAELLLEKKRLCLEWKIETAGRKEIDYIPITKEFPKLLEQNDADAFRGHNAPPDY